MRRRPDAAVMAGLAIACASVLGAACGPSYQPARLATPASATAGPLRVEVGRVFLTDDVMTSGMGDGTVLVVELAVSNGGAQPYETNTASLTCLMELDSGRPAETRGLTPAGGGEGTFGGEGSGDGPGLYPITVGPGQTRAYWALFRGYRFPGSDAPRKITLGVPGPRGEHPIEIALADPARGLQRWNVAAPGSVFMYGARASTLFGSYTRAMGASTRITRTFAPGPVLWDLGLVSTVLVQTEGRLVSATSSFTGIGLEAHLTWPFLRWGAWQDPRALGVYAGGVAQSLLEIAPPPPSGADRAVVHAYGEGDAEVGLELDVGALRLAPSPFPLSLEGQTPPRWLLRLGYVHSWIGHGTANGYVTSIMLAWW